MPRTPNDDRSDAADPAGARDEASQDKAAPQRNPRDGRSQAGEPRDQGDQTEDNRKQQE